MKCRLFRSFNENDRNKTTSVALKSLSNDPVKFDRIDEHNVIAQSSERKAKYTENDEIKSLRIN